jgi:Ohr subfamily peroxiredoxin
VKLTTPGTPGDGTNPEQLLAAGWSSCFLSAIRIVASQNSVSLQADPVIDAEIDLCSGDEGYTLRARLNVSLPGLERHIAQSLLDGAEQACPYSKATRGNVDVVVKLV